jgi:hypothetical protein
VYFRLAPPSRIFTLHSDQSSRGGTLFETRLDAPGSYVSKPWRGMRSLRQAFAKLSRFQQKPCPPTANLLANASLSIHLQPSQNSAVREITTLLPFPPCTYVNTRPGLREGAVARCTTVRRTAVRSLECVGLTPLPSPANGDDCRRSWRPAACILGPHHSALVEEFRY